MLTIPQAASNPETQTVPRHADQPPAVRIAAVADIHVPRDPWDPGTGLAEHADALLVAGDVTAVGTVAEAEAAAETLGSIGIPIIAVLGNHDHHAGLPEQVATVLSGAGIEVLEGDATTVDVRGITVGVAGVKGFGGGFEGATAHEFGEDLMKAFVAHARDRASALEAALSSLNTDIRIAVTHYAPCQETLMGEPIGLYPFLGSYLLGQAIDAAGADLALHGHAHLGSERGATRGGTPVRNVAARVIGAPFRVYELAAVRAHADPSGGAATREWTSVDGGRLWEQI